MAYKNIDGEKAPCGDQTNEGDGIFRKIQDRELGVPIDPPQPKPTAGWDPRKQDKRI